MFIGIGIATVGIVILVISSLSPVTSRIAIVCVGLVFGLAVGGISKMMYDLGSEDGHAAGKIEGLAEGARTPLHVEDMQPGLYQVIGCVPGIAAAVVTEPDGKTALYHMECGTGAYGEFVVGQFYKKNADDNQLVVVSDKP